MTIAYVNQAENSISGGASPMVCGSSLTLATGDIVEVQILAQTTGGTLTVSDGLGNTYALQASSAAVLSGTFLYTFVAQNCVSGTATPQATSSSGPVIAGIYAKQISGGATSSAVVGSISSVQAGPGSGANIVASGNVNIAVAKNVLISGFTVNAQSQTPLATAGTSPLAFTGRTAVWSVYGGGTAFTVPEDIRVVGASGNVQATFGVSGGGAQFDNFATNVIVYAELAAITVADGHTAAGTTVATGTGGAAMSAVTAGKEIDVLFMAQSATAQTCTCADQLGNVYTQIDHMDRTALSSREFYRFASMCTVPGTPVITCTYGASSNLNIAAAALTGISTTIPFTGGMVANHFQSAASIGGSPATDLQSSTNTPTLSFLPTTLAVWGYCDGKNAAPTTGTAFTAVGTPVWASLGTACLSYETEIYNSTTAVSGRFTPVASQDAYTFIAAFNQIGALAPLALRQACVADSGATSVLFQNGSFGLATLPGSTIFVVCKGSSLGGNQFTSFADSVNGNYQALDSVTDASTNFKAFVFQNAAAVGIAQAFTVNASVSQAHLGFVAYEIQGTSPASLAAHAVALQTLATVTANAITTGQVQAGVGSAIAIGVAINATGNNGVSSEPAVGTGFTVAPSPGGAFWSAFGALQATGEFQAYTNPGGISATFTAGGASSDDYVSFIAVFNSIGGAFVPPFTQNQFFVNDQYIQM